MLCRAQAGILLTEQLARMARSIPRTRANALVLVIPSVPSAAISAGPKPILKRGVECGAAGGAMAGLAT